MAIKDWLAHPLTRGRDIDDPATTELRYQIIESKSFLRKIYQEWYESLAATLPSEGQIIELGSGGGFLRQYLPHLITSEIFPVRAADVVLDAHRLPFANGALSGIVMNNVLHHLSQPRLFFQEAARCVRIGGVITMNEPWTSGWSQWVYTHLHHEPFDTRARSWEFPSSGPLSGANGALPWIIFERDRKQFEAEFPEWHIQQIVPHMPFRYLVSGGISLRSLMPGCTFGIWQGIEDFLSPWSNKLAMFALILLQRKEPELCKQ